MSETAQATGVPEWDQADRMRKSLRESGESVNEMAHYLEVDPATVSRWINGKQPASTQTLRLWALKTGVPYEWLKNGVAPGSPDPDDGLDSSTAQKPAALAQSAERFTRNDESHEPADILPLRIAA